MNGLRMEEFRKIVDEIYQELKIFDGEDSRCSFFPKVSEEVGGTMKSS